MSGRYAVLAAVGLAGILGATTSVIFFGGSDDRYASCRRTAVAGAEAIGGPFTLVSETGETVTDTQVFTKPSLVYFGYTFCPDVCPIDAARNAEAVDLLSDSGHDVLPVFVSIDPERDTPEVMAEFTDYLHPEMIGLTGSPEQIKEASKAYRTYYRKQPSDDEFYLVDHSSLSYLVLPETGFVEFFRRDMEAADLAEQIGCFLSA